MTTTIATPGSATSLTSLEMLLLSLPALDAAKAARAEREAAGQRTRMCGHCLGSRKTNNGRLTCAACSGMGWEFAPEVEYISFSGAQPAMMRSFVAPVRTPHVEGI